MAQWAVDEPFSYVNEEDAQFQYLDHPKSKPHPEYLTGWEADNQSGVKARLLEVVHGYKDNDKDKPRTLVVFEFVLVTGNNRTRLQNVNIVVGFRATGTRPGVHPGHKLPGEWDPVPLNFAPKDAVTLGHYWSAAENNSTSHEFGVKLGYDPYASATAKHTATDAMAVERLYYRYVTSTPAYYQKNSGQPNAMRWQLVENAALRSGVQYVLRTAVLLRRRDYGTFDVVTVIEANDSFAARTMRVLRKILPRDSPAGFDPTVLPGTSNGEEEDDNVAARATARDWKHLHGLNLDEILVKDWGIASFEELQKHQLAAAAAAGGEKDGTAKDGEGEKAAGPSVTANFNIDVK